MDPVLLELFFLSSPIGLLQTSKSLSPTSLSWSTSLMSSQTLIWKSALIKYGRRHCGTKSGSGSRAKCRMRLCRKVQKVSSSSSPNLVIATSDSRQPSCSARPQCCCLRPLASPNTPSAAIESAKYRIPSDLRSQARCRLVSTVVGDYTGILGAAVVFLPGQRTAFILRC